MTRLPPRPTRELLRAFALVGAVSVAVVAGAALARVGAPVPFGWAAILGLLLAIGGWRAPQRIVPAYEEWNALARRVSRWSRFGISLICLGVLTAVRLGGRRVVWRPPGGSSSGWMPREGLDAESMLSPADVRFAPSEGGLRALAAWSWVRKEYWLLALLPFLAALRAIAPEREIGLQHTSYTLY